jgi:hypothetical protein
MLLGVRDAQEFLVEPSASVRADLLALSEAVDEPGADVEFVLRDLGASCALAVTSCPGFSITLVVDSATFSVTLLEEPLSGCGIVTSVTIPLAGLIADAAGSEITFYATKRGGLVDLAADLSYALGASPDAAQFDLHLTPDAPGTRGTGLDHVRSHNQALGILLERGFDLEQARAELHRLARQAQTTPEIVATRLIDAATWPANPEPT